MNKSSITKTLRGCKKCRIITQDIRYPEGVIFERKSETITFLKFNIAVLRGRFSKRVYRILNVDQIQKIEVLE